MGFLNQQVRTFLLATVVIIAVVCLLGCGNGGYSSSGSGSFTDSRDGQKYKTVKIGNKTWTAENIRYKIGGSWCYSNDDNKCQQYGRLYDWNMAKIACPNGWHLPSSDDWTELVIVASSEISGKKLKSTSGWANDGKNSGNGTNDYGFSALPGGYRSTVGRFDGVGRASGWWTASETNSGGAYSPGMYSDADYVSEHGADKRSGFYVRCVQDN